MIDIKDWKEISRGVYRYDITDKVAYEIVILYWDKDSNINTAMANLYFGGFWVDKYGRTTLERDCLLENAPVIECVDRAVQDDKLNNI